jgi:hypothetical protein
VLGMSAPISLHCAFVLLVALRAVPATGLPDAPASPAPAPVANQERETLATIKPMSEDKRVKADAIDQVMAEGKVFFLDVREPKEIEEHGSYEGYVNIPMSQLESRLGELPKDRPILTA